MLRLENDRGGFHYGCGSRQRFATAKPWRRLTAGLFITIASRLPAQHCDAHYRWRQKIDDTHLTEYPTHTTTVASMLHWPVPSFSAANIFWCRERNARERRVYQVIAWARRLKVESGAKGDGDWHIELTNSKRGNVANCIVIEIPPPKLNDAYFTARQEFLKAVGDAGATIAQNGDVSPPVRIRVTGLPFFDGEHRGAGSNPPNHHGRCNSTVNALWEIHPVYSMGRGRRSCRGAPSIPACEGQTTTN